MKKTRGWHRALALVMALFLCLQTPAGVVFAGEAAESPPIESAAPAMPAETSAPTAVPEPAPTAEPAPEPTAEPAPEPTAEPEPEPTAEPEPAPTAEPEPTVEPEPVPTAEPEPTEAPKATATPEASPSPSATPAPTEEPEKRAPMDITSLNDELALGLVKATLSGQEPLAIENRDNTLDLSAIDADKAGDMVFEFSFDFLKSAEIRNIRGGDIFTINLQVPGLNFADTQAPVSVYNRQNRQEDSLTGDLLASYEILQGVLTVKLSDFIDKKEHQPQIIGRIPLKASLDKGTLSAAVSSHSWKLCQHSAVDLKLPAIHIPGDITNKMNQVEVTLAAVRFKDKVFANKEGSVKITLPGEKEEGGWALDYALTITGKKGDKIFLPVMAPAFTPEERDKQIPGAGTLAGEGDRAVLTLSEALQAKTLTLQLPVTLNAEAVKGLKDSKLQVTLQKEGEREKGILLFFAAPAVKKAEPKANEKITAGPDKEQVIKTEWLDYSNVDTRPDFIALNMFQVEFVIDGGSKTLLSGATMGQLGLTAMPDFTKKTGSGVGFEEFAVSLPETITDDTGAVKKVTYKLSMTTPGDYIATSGYMPPEEDGGVWKNSIQHTFVMDLDIKGGSGSWVAEGFLSEIDLYNNGSNQKINALSGLICTVSGNRIEIKGIPAFNHSKVEQLYYAKANDAKKVIVPGVESGDYFEPINHNENAPNFGGVTDKTHDGGMLRLILTGETDYEMTKEWLDNGEATGRPSAEVHLWRYKEGSDYKAAAPVKENGVNLVKSISTNDNTVTVAFGQDPDAPLPKYDPEGYRYIYLTREILGSVPAGTDYKYEQVFGEVSLAEGKAVITDTKPDGSKTTEKRGDSGDKSVYDTGVLSNRRTATETITQKKTWDAAAHQNDLTKVSVTLRLEKEFSDDKGTWHKTDTTRELSGFTSEQLTQTTEATVPKYDDFGKELNYRWVEERITEDGVEVALKTENGKTTFKLGHNVSEAGDEDWYESVTEPDGTIVNRLVGKVDYTVDKLWAQLDDQGNPIKDGDGKVIYGKTAPAGASVTVKLLQDANEYTNSTSRPVLDGTVGDLEFEPYSMRFTDLPKYNDHGRKYVYVAEEGTQYSSWDSAYSYNAAGFLADGATPIVWDAQIKNTPVGQGDRIKIRKWWMDDGDIEHRQPVTVKVTMTYKDSGGQAQIDDLGEHTLTADKNWWGYVGYKKLAGSTGHQFILEETAMGANKEYPVVNSQVTTDHHRYVVEYKSVSGEYIIVNRRIDTVDVTVTKKWVDKDFNAQSEPRPGARLKLEFVETDRSYQIDYTSKTIDLGFGAVSIGDALIQNVGNGDNESYQFRGLPKYDSEGRVAHYRVREVDALNNDQDFSHSVYAAGITDEKYVSADRLNPDQQSLTMNNKRVGTKEVYFFKQWKDEYVFKAGKRPDIYLTLWAKDSSNDGKPYILQDYKDRIWKAGSGTTNDYFWKCDFGKLPKYDGNGQEIIYYATETMSVDGKPFDYEDVILDAGYKTCLNADGSIATGHTDGDDEILKEEGTFTNGIKNTAKIEGKKIWKNVEAGFPNMELPGLTIEVDQYQGATETANKIAYFKVVPDPNSLKEWSFGLAYKGENRLGTTGKIEPVTPGSEELPKYNDAGKLYSYKVREVVDNTWAGDKNAYEALPADAHDYLISNVFNISDHRNKGALKVEKDWAGTVTVYPVTEFELWQRAPITAGGTAADWKLLKTEKLKGTAATDKPTALTFDGLPVYAPNGVKYDYRVREKLVNGYTTAVDGNGEASNDTAKYSAWTKIVTLTAGVDKDTPATAVAAGKFTNTYTGNPKVSISGKKIWDDQSNAMGIRPADITLGLWRYANVQSGGFGVASKDKPENTQNTVQLSANNVDPGNSNHWKYSFTNLERYAPNGMPWIYIVKEDYGKNPALRAYDIAQKQVITVEQQSVAFNGNVTMKPLTNSSKKSFTVSKKWLGDLESHLQPVSITAKLQVRFGNGAWKDASTALTGVAVADAVLNKGNGWSKTYSNLPAYAKNSAGAIEPCFYRSVETKITTVGSMGVDLTVTNTGDTDAALDPAYNDCWIYKPSSETKPDVPAATGTKDTTVITNTVKSQAGTTKELEITKTWKLDSGNAFKSRPMNGNKWEVTVKLQVSVDNNPYTDLLGADGKAVTASISGTDGDATATTTVKNLPVTNMEGKNLAYRAVEMNGSTALAEGDKLGSYTVSYNGTTDDATVITNTLDATELKLTKKWAGEDTAIGGKMRRTPEFTLWSRVGTTETNITDQYKSWPVWSAEETLTFAGLPQKDPDGTAIIYFVKEKTVEGYKPATPAQTVVVDASKQTTEITNTMTKVAFGKTDANDAAAKLKGYTFEIYDGSTKLATWKDAGGAVTVTQLVNNQEITMATPYVYGLTVDKTYTLKETKAPAGYNLPATPVTFKLDADGEFTVLTGAATASGDKLTLMVKDHKSKFMVEKRAVDKGVAGGFLPGAKLAIYGLTPGAKPIFEWTSEKTAHSFEGLPSGDYVLREITTPEGYATADPIAFTFNAETNEVKVGGAIQPSSTLTMLDKRIYGEVELTKKSWDGDVMGAGLPGAKFDLFAKGASTAIGQYTTDSVGKIHLELPYGEYYLQENDAPDGYLLDPELKWEFKIEGVTENAVVSQPVKQTETLGNKKFKTAVALTKVGDKNVPLQGVSFALSKQNKDQTWTVKDSALTTGEDGQVKVDIGEAGTYRIQETDSAEGYYFDPDKAFTAEFTVDNTKAFHNETLILSDKPAQELADKYKLRVINAVGTSADKVSNQLVDGTAVLTKTDKDGNALKGVAFDLYKKGTPDSKVNVSPWGTDEQGQIAAKGLSAGEYYFKETKTLADKQLLVGNIEFTISSTEKAPVLTLTPVKNQDYAGKAGFVKRDEEGNGLSGVGFALYRKEEGKFKPYENIEKVSDADGKIEVELTRKGTYKFVETLPAPGYAISPEAAEGYTFELTDTETNVQVSGGTVTNPKNELKILKTDQEGNVLSGAAFKLTGKFSDNETEKTWSSKDTAQALKGLLIADERYTLTETAAPAGCILRDEPIYFQMEKSGAIAFIDENGGILSGLPANVGYDKASCTLTVKNEKTHFTIGKLSDNKGDQAPLAGAELTLYDKDGNALRVLKGQTSYEITGLSAGTYTVKETKTPDGYLTAQPFKLKLTDKNEVALLDTPTDAMLSPDKKIQLLDRRVYGDVALNKTGKDGSALDGVSFDLYKTDVDKAIQTGLVTANGGKITVAGLEYGSYYFVETETTGDHKLDGKQIPFNIQPKAEASDGVTINKVPDTKVLNVANEAYKSVLKLTKADNLDSSKGVEGAAFTLAYRKDSTEAFTDVKTGLITGTDGVLKDGKNITVQLDKKGEYRITETDAPAGYVYDEATAYQATFQVTDALYGKTLLISDVPGADAADWSLQVQKKFGTSATAVTNERVQATVSLEKKDEGGKALAAVEFDLYLRGAGSDSKINSRALVTDENGKITVTGLNVGSYYFKETKTHDDKLLISGEAAVFEIVRDDHNKTLTLEVSNKDFKAAAFLIKTDAEDGKAISGAEFTLYKKDGEDYKPYQDQVVKSDKDGRVEVSIHHKGDYRLTETAPAPGYALGEAAPWVDFSIDNTQDFHGKTQGLGRLQNSRTAILVAKVSPGGMNLAGAEFKLSGNFVGGTEQSITWTSEGEPHLLKGKLIAGESYVLTELKAPSGYLLAQAPITLRLDEKGNLSTGDNNTQTVENEPIRLLVQKFSPSGEKLKGCVFSVTGVFAPLAVRGRSAPVETIIVDDEHPDALEGRLVPGNTYTLQEMTAPDGFVVGGAVDFKVNEKGVMELTTESTEYKKDENGNIVMTDDATTMKFAKTDHLGKYLAGAQFTVNGKFADGSESLVIKPEAVGALEVHEMFIEGQRYTLTETQTPKGYLPLEAPVVFDFLPGNLVALVGENPKATLTSEKSSETIEKTIFTLSVENQPAPPPVRPTPTPEVKPTPTPEVKPTPTPEVKPTATPTAKPTQTPKPGSPTTGDNAPLVPLAAALLLSAGALAVLAGKGAKGKKR